jgi:hypothetical protein
MSFIKLLTLIIALTSTSYSYHEGSRAVNVNFNCISEAHGGGCGNELLDIKYVSQAYRFTAKSNKCLNTECNYTFFKNQEVHSLDYLKLRMDNSEDGLLVKSGEQIINVEFYDFEDNLIAEQSITIDATYNEYY